MRPLLLTLGFTLLLSACGQSGKLVLPEKAAKAAAPAAQPAAAEQDEEQTARPPAAPQPSAPTPP